MSTPTHICPTCELRQSEGDGFCLQCGTALVPERFCEGCGLLITHTGEFCRECGTRVPPASIPAPNPQKPPPENRRSTPRWMQEPEPEPPRPTPKWMQDPEPEPKAEPKPRRRRQPPPAPNPVPSQLPPSTPPASNAPLQRRPTAAPVPMRANLPVPYKPSTGDNALALVAGTAGILSIVAAASSVPLAVVLFMVMFILGGVRLRHRTANAIGGVIDWLWEDPVLRRRLLGE